MPAARRPRATPVCLGLLACAVLGSCSAHRSDAWKPAPRPAPDLAGHQTAPQDSRPLSGSSGEFACPVFDPTEAGKHLRNAIEPLMSGDEVEARTELRLALCQDPSDEAAKSLLSHLDAVPEELLGEEFFVYTVRADDSMPKIAKEFLGDPYKFYLLARYNGMGRAGRLRIGQCLRIPGPSGREERNLGERLYLCGVEELQAGEVTNANEFLRKALEAEPDRAQALTMVREIRPAVVEAYRRDAVAALREQKLAQVIWNARKILEADPGNAKAKTMLRETQTMQSRLVDLFYDEAVAAFERQDWAEAIANCDQVLALDPGYDGARALRSRVVGR